MVQRAGQVSVSSVRGRGHGQNSGSGQPRGFGGTQKWTAGRAHIISPGEVGLLECIGWSKFQARILLEERTRCWGVDSVSELRREILEEKA